MRLHINIDHVATLRNARGAPYPDPVRAALTCLEAGADGITAHLREDRRHINDVDVDRLRLFLARRDKATFNLEMAATDEMVAIALRVKPDVVTLVPERRAERTTEGGLSVAGGAPSLSGHVAALRAAKIKVSLFIAPDAVEVDASSALGVEQIELHTGEYAHATLDAAPDAATRELARLLEAARRGREHGLEIAAGHGLTTVNVPALARVHEIVELNIGHAVISDALFLSLEGAVHAMRAAMEVGRTCA
jgi:pyridoxine 5-phosphate synthase